MEMRQETHPHDGIIRNSVRISRITCGSNVERHQTSDDFRRCDQNWRNAFCMSSDYPTGLEGEW